MDLEIHAAELQYKIEKYKLEIINLQQTLQSNMGKRFVMERRGNSIFSHNIISFRKLTLFDIVVDRKENMMIETSPILLSTTLQSNQVHMLNYRYFLDFKEF